MKHTKKILLSLLALAAFGNASQAQDTAPRHEVSASFQGLGLGSMPFRGGQTWNDQPGLSLGFGVGYTYWFGTHFGIRSGVRVNFMSHNQEISNFDMPFSSSLPMSSLGFTGGSGTTTVNLRAMATSVQEEQHYTFVEVPLMLAMRFHRVYANLGVSLAKAVNATADYSYSNSSCSVTELPDLGVTPATPVPLTLNGETEGSVKNNNMTKPLYFLLAAEVGYNIPITDVTNLSVGLFGRLAPIAKKTDNTVDAYSIKSDATYQLVQPSTSTLVEKQGYYEVGLSLGLNFGVAKRQKQAKEDPVLTTNNGSTDASAEDMAAAKAARERTEKELAAAKAAREKSEAELAAAKAARERAEAELAAMKNSREKAESDLASRRNSNVEQNARKDESNNANTTVQKNTVAANVDVPLQFYFDYGKSHPIRDEESETKLQNLCNAMKNDGNIRVVVTGYTDNVGTKRNNLKVGRRRANAVKRMMTEMGAPAENISVATCGEDEPFETNNTEGGRAKNRRAIVKLQ